MRIRTLVFGFCLLLCACEEKTTEPIAGIAAQTDKTIYTSVESISITVVNRTRATVELPTCCSELAYHLDSLAGKSWGERAVIGLPCLMLCPSEPFRISPDSTGTGRTRAYYSGTFRMRIPYGPEGGAQETGEIITNAFTVQ